MEQLHYNTFQEKTSKGIVVVDFYANWCGPCKMLSPILEELAQEYPQVAFYQVNVDDEKTLAKRHGVMSIPTLQLWKDGKLISTTMGYSPKEMLITFIKRAF